MAEISRRTALKIVGVGCAAAAAATPGEAQAKVTRQPNAEDYGLLVDVVRCVGCRACVTKCKEANGKPADVRTVAGAAYDAPVDLNAQTLTVVKRWGAEREAGFVKA